MKIRPSHVVHQVHKLPLPREQSFGRLVVVWMGTVFCLCVVDWGSKTESYMTLIQLIVLILVIGFVMWLVNQLPVAAPFKNIAYGLSILLVILIVLEAFGIIHTGVLTGGRIGR